MCVIYTQASSWHFLSKYKSDDQEFAIIACPWRREMVTVAKNDNNNNNEYLERLNRTGPKRLHVLYKYILSKFKAYNMNAHTHARSHTHGLAHARAHAHTYTPPPTHQWWHSFLVCSGLLQPLMQIICVNAIKLHLKCSQEQQHMPICLSGEGKEKKTFKKAISCLNFF